MLFVQQIDSFEEKLAQMAAQLDAQYELNRVSDRKTKRSEQDLLEMEQKLRQLECAKFLPSDNAVLLEQEKVCMSSRPMPSLFCVLSKNKLLSSMPKVTCFFNITVVFSHPVLFLFQFETVHS